MVTAASALDARFHALADPTRRAMLARLVVGDAAVTELAEPFDVSLPAVSKHLRVLEDAGLIARERDGRVRRCRLLPTPLAGAAEWIARYRRFWTAQLDALGRYLADSAPEEEPSCRSRPSDRRPRSISRGRSRPPPDTVFRAWTDPDTLKRWWARRATPPRWSSWTSGQAGNTGSGCDSSRTERYSTSSARMSRWGRRSGSSIMGWENEPAGRETRVTVEFHDSAGATEVVLTHEMFPTREARDQHEAGWTGSLEKFVTFLAERS